MPRILIVDDDRALCRLLAEYLQREGFVVDLAHDGETALTQLRNPALRPDLLILDLAQRSRNAAEAGAYFHQAELEIVRLDRMTGEMLALSRLEGGIPGMRCDNLIGNAIKFSAEGGDVELLLHAADGVAVISVRDRGPGVPETELESLGRPFFRGSNAVRADGHGLGLAIVQRVVKVHGGELHVSNRDGGGLDVHLRLPLAAADALV